MLSALLRIDDCEFCELSLDNLGVKEPLDGDRGMCVVVASPTSNVACLWTAIVGTTVVSDRVLTNVRPTRSSSWRSSPAAADAFDSSMRGSSTGSAVYAMAVNPAPSVPSVPSSLPLLSATASSFGRVAGA